MVHCEEIDDLEKKRNSKQKSQFGRLNPSVQNKTKSEENMVNRC